MIRDAVLHENIDMIECIEIPIQVNLTSQSLWIAQAILELGSSGLSWIGLRLGSVTSFLSGPVGVSF